MERADEQNVWPIVEFARVSIVVDDSFPFHAVHHQHDEIPAMNPDDPLLTFSDCHSSYQSTDDILFFDFKSYGLKFPLKRFSTLFVKQIRRQISSAETVDKNKINSTLLTRIACTRCG